MLQGSASYIDSPIDYSSYDGLPYWRKFENGSHYTETLDSKHPVFNTTYQTSQIGNRSLAWIQYCDFNTCHFLQILAARFRNAIALGTPSFALC